MKHSELPFSIMDSGAITMVYGPNGERVCRLIDNKKNDAIFICRACNNHEKLLSAVKGVLAISDLWLPSVVSEEHEGEAQALHSARDKMIQVIEEAKG